MGKRDERYSYFSIFDAVMEDDYLWFSNNTFNAICKCELATLKVEILGYFNNYEKCHQRLHRKVLKYQNRLFFIPHKEQYIDIFDIENKEQYSIDLPEIMWEKNDFFVSDAYLINKEIWIFPLNSKQAVLIYDIEKNEFRENKKLSDFIKKYTGTVLTYKSVCVYGSCIWLVILHKNIILKYDYVEDEMEEIRLERSNLYSIYVCENKIWLGTLDEYIIVLNKYNYEIEYISEKIEKILDENLFAPMINDGVAVVLTGNESTIRADRIVEVGMKNVMNRVEGIPTMFWCKYENDFWIFPYYSSIIIKLNCDTFDVEFLEWKIEKNRVSNNYYEEYIKPRITENNKLGRTNESIFYDFSDFMAYILCKEEHCKQNIGDIKYGNMIYRASFDRKEQ